MRYPFQILESGYQRIPKRIKWTFASTFIFGMLVHLFMFTNKLPNHDDINQTFDSMYRPAYGRWFTQFPGAISSEVSMPWVGGALSMLYISLAACFVVSCFGIKKTVHNVLTGMIMVSFPTVCGSLMYMNMADASYFAMLLASIAAYCAHKYRFGFLASILLLTLSLGIYQAYFPFAATLMLGMLALDLLKNEKPVKAVIFQAGKDCLVLLAAMGLYSIITYLVNPDGLSHSMMHGIDNMSILQLFSLVPTAYQAFFDFFLNNSFEFHTALLSVGFGIIFVIDLTLIIGIIYQHRLFKQPAKVFLLVLALVFSPLAVSLIYVMSVGGTPHSLMIYPHVLPLIYGFSLVEVAAEDQKESGKKRKKEFVSTYDKVVLPAFSCMMIIVLTLNIYNYSILSNQAYFQLQLVYERGKTYSDNLVGRIERIDGYSTEQEVVFIGKPNDNPIKTLSPKLNKLTGLINSIPQTYSYRTFLQHYLGFPNRILLADSGEIVVDEAVVSDMPAYPADGAIQVVGDYIYVCFQSNHQEG